MKLLTHLTIASALIAGTANAYEWSSQDLGGREMYAVTYNTGDQVATGVIYNRPSCRKFGDQKGYDSIVVVNGTPVKYDMMCIDKGVSMSYPQTVQGSRYVVGTFKKSLTVNMKLTNGTVLRFSAEGFNKGAVLQLMSKRAI